MTNLTPSDKALVPFVSVDNMMKLIHHIGIEPMLIGLGEYIEADFKRWELFDKTPRVASHSEQGVIELMPTSDGEVYGFKYVNGHPSNTAEGLQTVTAFGLKAIVGIDEVRLYDIDKDATAKCAANLQGLGIKVVPCDTAEEAMLGAQIVTTCTADKQYATILTDNMVGSGIHINAIGGDCPGKTELAPAILHRAGIFVEYPEQTRIEGEIQQLEPDHPVTEIWQVLTGQAQGRTDDKQITLFDSVGFAIEDFSALRYVRDQIKATDLFDPLDLLADPEDPRDLFGMLQRAK